MWKKVSGRWISVAAMRRRVMTCWSYFWIAFAPFYIKRFRKVRIFDENTAIWYNIYDEWSLISRRNLCT